MNRERHSVREGDMRQTYISMQQYYIPCFIPCHRCGYPSRCNAVSISISISINQTACINREKFLLQNTVHSYLVINVLLFIPCNFITRCASKCESYFFWALTPFIKVALDCFREYFNNSCARIIRVLILNGDRARQ